ncbi:MAG: DUF3576 domain-containing protein [Pseudomonadota bacterium]
MTVWKSLVVMSVLVLVGCNNNIEQSQEISSRDSDGRQIQGSLLGGEGGFVLNQSRTTTNTSGIGVNGYLWRASLDTLETMPISLVDPFGGVILTDWHAMAEHPDVRHKINLFIRGQDLRTPNLKVTVFKQRREADGRWVTVPLPEGAAQSIEDVILTRARDLRLITYAP